MSMWHIFDDTYNEDEEFSAEFVALQRSGVCLIRHVQYTNYSYARFSSRKDVNVVCAQIARYLYKHFEAIMIDFDVSEYRHTGQLSVTYVDNS